MALNPVVLPKRYRNGRVLFEQNLDDWRRATEQAFATLFLNLTQLQKDLFLTGYQYTNTGNPQLGSSLQAQINGIISGGSGVNGTTSATFTINSSASSATLDTSLLTAPRTFYFPNESGVFMLLDATQTFRNKTSSNLLQVVLGAGGGAATNARTAFKVENNAEVYIEFETPSTNQAGLIFSDNVISVGQFIFDHNVNEFSVNQPMRFNGIVGDVAFDTNTLFVDATNNRVGVRTASPTAPFHIQMGAGGGAAVNARSGILLENSNEVYIEFETPNTNQAGFLFSDNAASVGQLLYDHNINQFTLNQTASIVRNVAAGSAAINANTLLKLENNTDAYIEFVNLSTDQGGLIFTDNVSSFGQFIYDHNIDSFTVNQNFLFGVNASVTLATGSFYTDGGAWNRFNSATAQSMSMFVKGSGAAAVTIFTAATTGAAVGNVTWGVDIAHRFQGNLRPELDNTYQFGNSIAGGDLSNLRWSTINCMEIITAAGFSWDMGDYTAAGDAASNGYVDVTIAGVAYRLATRA